MTFQAMRSRHCSIGTRKHADCGKRVEIPAHSDLWMRGARFGTVERVIDRSSSLVGAPTKGGGHVIATTMTEERAVIWRVRLDHPQARRRLYGFYAAWCTPLA